jgi:hypothetical protein
MKRGTLAARGVVRAEQRWRGGQLVIRLGPARRACAVLLLSASLGANAGAVAADEPAYIRRSLNDGQHRPADNAACAPAPQASQPALKSLRAGWPEAQPDGIHVPKYNMQYDRECNVTKTVTLRSRFRLVTGKTTQRTPLLPSLMAPSTPSASGMQLTWQEVWTKMRYCAMMITHLSALGPATLCLHRAPMTGGALTAGRQGRRDRRSEWCGCSAGSLWDLRSDPINLQKLITHFGFVKEFRHLPMSI